MNNILVCDDDKDIVKIISVYLTNEGYNVKTAYNGREALDILEREEIHLLILDIMMPEIDGIQTAIKIRETWAVPIIMLSAKGEDIDKILGLNVGADDYLTKPFNPLELIARVKSQLRRYTLLGGKHRKESDEVYSTGQLVVDDNRKIVEIDGSEIKLTPIEYKILLYMIKMINIISSLLKLWRNNVLFLPICTGEGNQCRRYIQILVSSTHRVFPSDGRQPKIHLRIISPKERCQRFAPFLWILT